MDYLKDMKDRLVEITKGCREDMHEPDENGVKAWIVGNHLDNAFGDSVTIDAITGNFQEFVVVIERFYGEKHHKEFFNLATLIAVARQ